MAGFRTHVGVSTTLGVAYAGFGVLKGIPVEGALVAGGLCGLGGMLPDMDSESGVPLREITSLAAAVSPMLMLERFQLLFGFNHEQIVLAGGLTYLFVRFGLSRLLKRITVHRGMFHSIPALLIFVGVTFLICGSMNLRLRYFKSAGVGLGVLSHLVLDEIYSVEWKGGRWQFKRSFGTARKMWGKVWWANLAAYAGLALVALMILSEPAVMERYGQLSPIVLQGPTLRERLGLSANDPLPPESEWNAYAAAADQRRLWGTNAPPTPDGAGNEQQQGDRTIYDTTRRILRKMWN